MSNLPSPVRRVGWLAGLALACAAATPAAAQPLPEPRLFRWEEDYRALAPRARAGDLAARLKHAEIAPGAVLSLGGTLRERIELRDNPFPGRPRRSEEYLLHRGLLHAELRLGPHLRGFAELVSAFAPGKASPLAPPDQNRLDLSQAFLEAALPLGLAQATLRAGRQELAFDAQRYVTVRNGPNLRQSFDALRLDLDHAGMRLTGFASWPVRNQDRTAFDDASDRAIRFHGLHAEAPAGGMRASAYLYGYERDAARFGGSRGDERRIVLGLRLLRRQGPVGLDAEAMLQTGRFAGQDILAWGGALDLVAEALPLPQGGRLGLQLDIASGDARAGDRRLGTFNPLFPRATVFSEASWTGNSNLIHLKPNVVFRPIEGLALSAAAGFLWRHHVADAIYLQPFAAVPRSAGRGSAYTGAYGQLRLAARLARGVDVSVELVRFEPGAGAAAAGGRGSSFLGVELSTRF